ncbi:GtrA family protein [Candidatus Liberibacter sp.]|uniref:GtrA family protein n=1 Tax=Candidatus Liberibacter sp. TaxID=34022 RepID=UPI0015F35E00|nr:GtrA family protein [Candidatus Liberibacter sp.]MBA5724272.1 GtrA family protein [Candidatus Liberibacter sp.]
MIQEKSFDRYGVKKIIIFGINGLIGFVVDAFLLFIVIRFGINPFLGRAFAMGMALLATWQLNRFFAFKKKSRHGLFVEAICYGTVGISSAILNYAIYIGLLILHPGLSPLLAMVLSSVFVMPFSFFGYARFVFLR